MKCKARPKKGALAGKEVEAFRWDADETLECFPDWLLAKLESDEITLVDAGTPNASMMFLTPNGIMVAHPGDWIIRIPSGHAYPSKAGLFESRFEVAA